MIEYLFLNSQAFYVWNFNNAHTTVSLEPQFGSSDNDVGLYVSVAPSGGAYVGAEEGNAFILKRFDNKGKLLWSKYISGTESSTPPKK